MNIINTEITKMPKTFPLFKTYKSIRNATSASLSIFVNFQNQVQL